MNWLLAGFQAFQDNVFKCALISSQCGMGGGKNNRKENVWVQEASTTGQASLDIEDLKDSSLSISGPYLPIGALCGTTPSTVSS